MNSYKAHNKNSSVSKYFVAHYTRGEAEICGGYRTPSSNLEPPLFT